MYTVLIPTPTNKYNATLIRVESPEEMATEIALRDPFQPWIQALTRNDRMGHV